ncbi:uncharacterized protein LOC132384160 [Hypanus sabinus]|uniref:uncharacterized protein LOC132384160 n=1 Tax=Hypanus sabinus TaxID=79690 RepID=UPI0028C3C60A|nr:uncharacterized protein LOC132384160 [Hypanus sabinus]
MGGGGSKKKEETERPGPYPGVPPDSPLGRMFENWGCGRLKGKQKKKMIQYCLIWSKQPIEKPAVWWPRLGSEEDWVRQALNIYVNSKPNVKPEEIAYAFCWAPWPGVTTKSFKLGIKGERKWDPLDHLPPPYVQPSAPLAGAEGEREESEKTEEIDPEREERDVREKAKARIETRSVTGADKKKKDELKKEEVQLCPLREVPMGGERGGTGFVNVPLTSTEVRGFKKDMKTLLEDPMGLAEQLDQFLGPNVYTWEEMLAIMGTLFSAQERQMIRQAAISIWEREQPNELPGDRKFPVNDPQWDKQAEERRRQYPIAMEGRRGLQPVIETLVSDGLLEECMSPFNTPILPVRKPDGTYRMVQDLRGLNAVVQTRHPVVPNPYTLMSKIPPEHEWFSVIDLKDAFWSCPLEEGSRDMFAFEWENPFTGRKKQLRWTVLPQGFTESPNLFEQVLEQVLAGFHCTEKNQLLQYVDDLLLSGPAEEVVRDDTIRLLNYLGEKGLRVSKKKLQFVEKEITYLGHSQ